MTRRIVLLFVLVVGAAPVWAADYPDPWVQATASGLELRAMVPPGADCPAVVADGVTLRTQVRAAPDKDFPVQVCAAAVPITTRKLLAGGLPVPALPEEVNRIVIIGDTGCRLKGEAVQACNNSRDWPFAVVARHAAARKPDLVIHVGDYHYRETPCPAGNTGCVGSPYGDNLAVWQADFFTPAAPLLAAAPWVVVRGNHELCGRGGLGWFRFLDQSAEVLDCPAMTAPYSVSLRGLDLLVLDSADADDATAPPAKVIAYQEQIRTLLTEAQPHAWLLSHRPFWALAEGRVKVGAESNATLRAAMSGPAPASLDMIVSGHIHDFATYDFGGARPAQLVVGDSGDANDDIVQRPDAGRVMDGLPLTRGSMMRDFGYLVLNRVEDGWRGTLHAVDDSVLARCRLSGRSIDCH